MLVIASVDLLVIREEAITKNAVVENDFVKNDPNDSGANAEYHVHKTGKHRILIPNETTTVIDEDVDVLSELCVKISLTTSSGTSLMVIGGNGGSCGEGGAAASPPR
ncbi:hypothetical protein BV898_01794 [Hypsibius exemplaris]|uniref:Uncharacterized protein n=1 Tax=Hypsibius exemplaris TaxID=2072580 RepID=A0A1W0XA32_HYPEX|nr:hypothetical protein BV898_01794 [Hypsibius exemplaris]